MDENDSIRFDVKYNREMIAPLDPRTLQFYMEMGYSEQQVRRAYDYSVRKQVDILDALAVTSQVSPPPSVPPKKQQNNLVQQPPPQKSGFASFLTPLAQVKNSDYEPLYSRSNKFNPLNSKNQLREPNNPVGLLNISNCCYLNSLIQCYFLMDKFKEILLTAEPLEDIAQLLADNKTKLKRVKNQYELLGKLKYFFTVMSLTSKKYLDPSEVLQNLVDSVGEKLTYGEEKDLSEINIMIIERLSEGLTFSKKFFKKYEDPLPSRSSFIDQGEDKTRFNSIFNPEQGFIKQLFYGTKVEYYQQVQLQKQEPIVSDFTGIILNPIFGTLQNALDEQFNFSVQINGQSFKKQMYIRDQPQYLFLYINRTEYNRQQQQMHKNDEKFVFDFVLYLDRYLEKYKKERGQKDERIRKLISERNRTKEQLSNLHLLFKKMEECFEYAAGLEGWEEKLPTVEDFQTDEARLNDRLNEVEHQLKQIQSRKEEYHLMYIFVHRGDAISGHYWGYGRNGANWYRFDINCRLIPQEQIIIDMQKSSGTPYALLYVKKENIPQCRYNYHTKVNMIQDGDLFFYKNFQQRLAEEIIKENIMLHQETMIKNHEGIKKKCFSDYVERYNALKRALKAGAKPKGEMSQLDALPVCNNFSLFLYSKQELQLCKFSIFQQSLLLASGNKINIDRLLTEGDLLGRIQKKFKAKCKGEYHLKNYAMVGKDLEKYIKYQEEYQLSIFQTVWTVSLIADFQRLLNAVEKLMKPGEFVEIDIDGPVGSFLANIVKSLKMRASFYHSQEYQRLCQRLQDPLYITQVNNEITKLVMLKLVVLGFKFQSLQKFVEISDAAGSQIAAINSYNSIAVSLLGEAENGLGLVEEMQEMVKKYLASNSKKQSSGQSAVKSERKSSIRQSDSPMKSVALTKLSSKGSKRASDCRLTAVTQANLLLTDLRQTWKLEELQALRPNFDLPSRTLSLLRRLSDIVRVYKHSLQHQRILTHQELLDTGIHLNQRKSQESLI